MIGVNRRRVMGGANGGSYVIYNETICVTNRILEVGGGTRSFPDFKTSPIVAIPDGTTFIDTSNLYKNDANVFIGLKFYTGDSESDVISDNVAASGEDIPATIDMSAWPTAKYVRFCTKKTSAYVKCY